MKDLLQTVVLRLYRFDWGRWIPRAIMTMASIVGWYFISTLIVVIKTGDGNVPAFSALLLRTMLEVALVVGVVFLGIRLWKRALKWALHREQLPILVAQKLEGLPSDDQNNTLLPWQNSGTTTGHGGIQAWSKAALPRP